MFDGYGTTTQSPAPNYPWEQFFAWLPVHVHGKRKWLTKVWRKQNVYYGDQRLAPPRYTYGNVFDVIKDEE